MVTLQEVYETYKAQNLGGKEGVGENFVPGDGPVPSKIMMIGEAPGADEDFAGKPFVGPAGESLNLLLGHIGLPREVIFLTNVFKYHPLGNRNPTPLEVKKSMKCLSAEIRIVNPKLIVPMGRVAINCFFPNATVRKARGRKIKRGDKYIFCTYHPATLLYSSGMKALLQKDFRKIKEILEEEDLV